MKLFLIFLAALLVALSIIAVYLKNKDRAYVYYINFKPESDTVLQELAKLYSEKTGIDVTVYTPPSGGYGEFMEKEMKKYRPPT